MKKAVIILDGIFVYLILILLILVFVNDNQISVWLWENVFDNNIYRPLAVIVLYELIMLIITAIFTINCMRCNRVCEREELISLAKTQMIVRIVQTPAYIAIFIAGSIGVITIFTIGISVALAVFDVLSIVVTGLSSVGVYALLGKRGMISQKERLIFSVAGFIYCFDVIVAIICYRQINERISA